MTTVITTVKKYLKNMIKEKIKCKKYIINLEQLMFSHIYILYTYTVKMKDLLIKFIYYVQIIILIKCNIQSRYIDYNI